MSEIFILIVKVGSHEINLPLEDGEDLQVRDLVAIAQEKNTFSPLIISGFQDVNGEFLFSDEYLGDILGSGDTVYALNGVKRIQTESSTTTTFTLSPKTTSIPKTTRVIATTLQQQEKLLYELISDSSSSSNSESENLEYETNRNILLDEVLFKSEISSQSDDEFLNILENEYDSDNEFSNLLETEEAYALNGDQQKKKVLKIKSIQNEDWSQYSFDNAKFGSFYLPSIVNETKKQKEKDKEKKNEREREKEKKKEREKEKIEKEKEKAKVKEKEKEKKKEREREQKKQKQKQLELERRISQNINLFLENDNKKQNQKKKPSSKLSNNKKNSHQKEKEKKKEMQKEKEKQKEKENKNKKTRSPKEIGRKTNPKSKIKFSVSIKTPQAKAKQKDCVLWVSKIQNEIGILLNNGVEKKKQIDKKILLDNKKQICNIKVRFNKDEFRIFFKNKENFQKFKHLLLKKNIKTPNSKDRNKKENKSGSRSGSGSGSAQRGHRHNRHKSEKSNKKKFQINVLDSSSKIKKHSINLEIINEKIRLSKKEKIYHISSLKKAKLCSQSKSFVLKFEKKNIYFEFVNKNDFNHLNKYFSLNNSKNNKNSSNNNTNNKSNTNRKDNTNRNKRYIDNKNSTPTSHNNNNNHKNHNNNNNNKNNNNNNDNKNNRNNKNNKNTNNSNNNHKNNKNTNNTNNNNNNHKKTNNNNKNNHKNHNNNNNSNNKNKNNNNNTNNTNNQSNNNNNNHKNNNNNNKNNKNSNNSNNTNNNNHKNTNNNSNNTNNTNNSNNKSINSLECNDNCHFIINLLNEEFKIIKKEINLSLKNGIISFNDEKDNTISSLASRIMYFNNIKNQAQGELFFIRKNITYYIEFENQNLQKKFQLLHRNQMKNNNERFFYIYLLNSKNKVISPGIIVIQKIKLKIIFPKTVIRTKLEQIKYLENRKKSRISDLILHKNRIRVYFEKSNYRRHFSKFVKGKVKEIMKYTTLRALAKMPIVLVDKAGEPLCDGILSVCDNKLTITSQGDVPIEANVDETFLQLAPIIPKFIVMFFKENKSKLYFELKNANHLKNLKAKFTVLNDTVQTNYTAKLISTSSEKLSPNSIVRCNFLNNGKSLIISSMKISSIQIHFTIRLHSRCLVKKDNQRIVQLAFSKRNFITLDFGLNKTSQSFYQEIMKTIKLISSEKKK
ncbi:set1 complex component shg1 [Anaeramoeba flamelloides]|uniref:Set1 complex component shg1 n=1 Tax=Anaeramoeba flamelloides TaxID=1746091 RepID=A0ABQ8YTW0_9EUKA|nr:set1 complex component shg1 [Anaeramoeba flamelloides]